MTAPGQPSWLARSRTTAVANRNLGGRVERDSADEAAPGFIHHHAATLPGVTFFPPRIRALCPAPCALRPTLRPAPHVP